MSLVVTLEETERLDVIFRLPPEECELIEADVGLRFPARVCRLSSIRSISFLIFCRGDSVSSSLSDV